LANRAQIVSVSVAVCILFIMSSVLLFQANVGSQKNTGTETAPYFSVKDIDDKVVSSSNLSGKVVVLHLAIIYCGGIITENGKRQLSELTESWQKSHDDAEYLTVTSENCPTTDLAKIKAEYNITWPVVNDWPELSIYKSYSDYFSQHGDPTIVIIDPLWKVVKHSGLMNSGEIIQAIADAESGGLSPSILGQNIGFAAMFGLGVVTSVAPCSIALLVTMLAFLMARNVERKPEKTKRNSKKKGEFSPSLEGLSVGLYFTLGTVTIFLMVGFLVAYLGFFVAISPVFFVITGIILIFLGLNSAFSLIEKMTGWIQNRFPAKSTGTENRTEPGWAAFVSKIWDNSSSVGAFLLGIFFSLAWAPCAISLVFPVIVMVLAAKVGLIAGGALLFFFGLGHAVPIIPIAVVTETSKAKIAKRYMNLGKDITTIFGFVIAIFGFMFILRGFGIYLW
jgi:cytochrome c-type biogenesis protein